MTGPTYRNPVWPHPFPDPFVFKFRGEYWGYCTGLQEDGRAFGVVRAGPRLLLTRRQPEEWALFAGEQIFPLPPVFDPFTYQQFRFRRVDRRVEIAWEGLPLGAIEAPPGPARIGLGARGAACFDAVRVTAIPG